MTFVELIAAMTLEEQVSLRSGGAVKAFGKVLLADGKTRHVQLDLDERAFAYIDVASRSWVAAPNAHQLMPGTDAESILSAGTLELASELALRP